MHYKHLRMTAPLLSLPLSHSLTYFEPLQHISLSLCAPKYSTNHHTLPLAPSPALSLTCLKHLQRTSLSLSALESTLQMTTPLLSLPFALANIFRALTAHLSLSLHSTHLQITTPLLSLPLAPSRSLSQYRCRGAADSGHAASACDVHYKTQQTRH